MTPQQKMQATLAETGIPYKRIECYGSQIVVTSWSDDAAKKWASLLHKFATVRGVIKSMDETKNPPGPYTKDRYHDVWRTFASV